MNIPSTSVSHHVHTIRWPGAGKPSVFPLLQNTFSSFRKQRPSCKLIQCKGNVPCNGPGLGHPCKMDTVLCYTVMLPIYVGKNVYNFTEKRNLYMFKLFLFYLELPLKRKYGRSVKGYFSLANPIEAYTAYFNIVRHSL